MKPAAKCCRKYQEKAKACRDCPLMAALGKKERRKCLKKARKRLRKAA